MINIDNTNHTVADNSNRAQCQITYGFGLDVARKLGIPEWSRYKDGYCAKIFRQRTASCETRMSPQRTC